MTSWSSLTPRQKDLDRALSKIEMEYFETKGEYFSNTPEVVDKVMRLINASEVERDFVIERIKLRIKLQNECDAVDRLVERVDSMLETFRKEDQSDEIQEIVPKCEDLVHQGRFADAMALVEHLPSSEAKKLLIEQIENAQAKKA
jgi:hypothetical protein